MSLDDELQAEFRRMGGFTTSVRDVSYLDHPLARFFRLMYTDEFEGFREFVTQDYSGVASMSKGVRKLLVDQIFRYFVFVKDSPADSTKFGQLICSIAIFRNTYDDDAKKFVETGLLKSRKRLFKNTNIRGVRASDEFIEYVNLGREGIPADYERMIANRVRELLVNPPKVFEEFDISAYNAISSEGLEFTDPLPVSTCVYSPLRKTVLHVMQLLSLFATPDMRQVDLIYTGTVPGDILQVVREMVPSNVRISPTLDKVNPEHPTIIIIDEEFDKEASSSSGDDQQLMKQINIIKGLKNTFRNKVENLLAVSTTFRIPTVLTSPGVFAFLPGTVFVTPWRNPQDERMRLVWRGGMETDLVDYSVRNVLAARKFLDYVLRPLIPHRSESSEEVESMGLINGEFDSELERMIVKRYYGVFAEGTKIWYDLASDDVITSPRFIGEQAMFGKVDTLKRFFEFVTNHHFSIPSNPLIQYASRCARGGLFPVVNLSNSPLKESIQKIFGDSESDTMFKTFMDVEEESQNVLLTIREKNILPRIREKTIVFNILKDLTERYKEIVSFEPKIDRSTPNFLYELVGGMDKSVSVVHLGDSFGNTLSESVEHLNYMRIPITEIIHEGSFPLANIWKDLSINTIPLFRLKNAFGLQERIDKLNTPFFIIRGHGYPQEVYESVIRSMEKTNLYHGRVEVVDGSIVSYPRSRTLSPMKRMAGVISDVYSSEIRSQNLSCLMIGSEYEFDLSFLTEKTFQRIFHVVESGAGGRKVANMTRHLRRINNKIFVQENVSSQFVSPVEDVTFDVIIIHPSVFSRIVKERESAVRFLSEIRKCMTQTSKIISLNVERIVAHMLENGKAIDGAKTIYSSDSFEGEVGEQTFRIFDYTGYQYSLDQVDRVFRESNFLFDIYSADTRYDDGSIHRMIQVMLIRTRMTDYVAPERQPYEVYEGQAVDVGSRVRAYNNLVKRSMIEETRDHTRVLDLACGHGQDIAKWFSHENMELYVGMDASESAIEEGEKRLRTKRGFRPRLTKMLTRDLFGSQNWVFDAESYLRRSSHFTSISCQLAIHYAFRDEKTIKRFMYNVSNLLEVGGEFIVTTIDDEALKNILETVDDVQATMGESVELQGEHYVIKMSSEMYSAVFNPVVVPGVSYEFTQFPSDPNSRKTTEYVVDNRYFKVLAEEMGLQMVGKKNFMDMTSTDEIDFDRERYEMSQGDREISSLYATYRFVKVSEAKESLTNVVQPFSYSESVKQYQQAMDLTSFATAEKIGTFKRGLFINPEALFPAPYVEAQYESMDVLTDDIGQVKPLYQQLKSQGKLSNKEVVHLSTLGERNTDMYDMIYVSHAGVSNMELYLDRLVEGGSLVGTYVSSETAERVLMGESEFANSVFQLVVHKSDNTYAINSSIESSSVKFTDVGVVRERANELGLTFEMIQTEDWQRDSKITVPQKQFMSVFGMFRITKTKPLEAQLQPVESQPEPEVVPTIPVDLVDKFVLLPGLAQKKAPGKGRDETLKSQGSVYKDLAKDSRWRFKLSDDWETNEFPIRMTSGHMFTSVTNAMIYYKCEFAEEENKDYLGLNLASGLPAPADVKPFTKAIRGKKGQQWKERELEVLRDVYEAKFANTPNAVDEPDNLTPLRALLLTRDAQLYSNSRTRNELLERVRGVLQRIVGI